MIIDPGGCGHGTTRLEKRLYRTEKGYIRYIQVDELKNVKVGEDMTFKAKVCLGNLTGEHNLKLIIYTSAPLLETVFSCPEQKNMAGDTATFSFTLRPLRPGNTAFSIILYVDNQNWDSYTNEIPVQISSKGYFEKKVGQFIEDQWKWLLTAVIGIAGFAYHYGKIIKPVVGQIFIFITGIFKKGKRVVK